LRTAHPTGIVIGTNRAGGITRITSSAFRTQIAGSGAIIIGTVYFLAAVSAGAIAIFVADQTID